MEEFEEADILWPDPDHAAGEEGGSAVQRRHDQHGARRKASNPVKIPSTHHQAVSCHGCDNGDSDGGEEDEGGRRIPPHAMVVRRMADEMAAFSECVGTGRRRLRGRELSQIRNSILRMTGFLER